MTDLSFIKEEAAELLLGDKIGSGVYRDVYECLMLPDCVVKVQQDALEFDNVMEWKIWQEVRWDDELSLWFAPCVHISANGRLLIMKKTTKAGISDFPTSLPVFLGDCHKGNYGMYEGRFVCHDYGLSTALRKGLETKRLRKVNWNEYAD